jgi:hypothetical protein
MTENNFEGLTDDGANEDVEAHRMAKVSEDDVEGHVQPRRDLDVER